ncbi:MAG: SGNH/GDSL hydrolase family protein [Planctomycetaceae bacterium]|nr:SGNH/GDSL hydrolase family protein [Planctomycetaceae bacterium]
MATSQATSVQSARITLAGSLLLLAVAAVPWPQRWMTLRSVIASARSPELNRAEREIHAAGYYEGLIGGSGGPEGARGELALRLLGKPNGWVRFNDAKVSRRLTGDFLQFELLPNIRQTLSGQPFVTNSHGMHSAEISLEKPKGTFRIAVLGASMDMGWGVTYEQTYSHQLEKWLCDHARRRGYEPQRRFEVLNFAVAAYSPLQRLETLRRKALAFHPDLVLYSATMLDQRLMEIHLCDMFREGIVPTDGFLKTALARAGIRPEELWVDAEGRLVQKEVIKAKLKTCHWDLYDATLGAIAGECRSAGVPLLIVIIPRVGNADAPLARAEPVARLKAIASRQAIPVFDLSDTFDRYDPASLEIAAWDDHPNSLGHRRLFLALAQSLAADREFYRLLFPDLPGMIKSAGVIGTEPTSLGTDFAHLGSAGKQP